ncbi:Fc.00g030020.m01.CDS01 [Cosmosporella sp. VM-42]
MPPLSRPTSRQRDPPPALFLHPSTSSPQASHVSLPGILAPGAPLTVARDRPNLERTASVRSGTVVSPNTQRGGRGLPASEGSRSADRTDALWAEMQATLEEVELSASGGTHVFGPDHDRKLADLRAAQIALAQAWARSEADDAIETSYRDHTASAAGDEVRNLKGALGDTSKSGIADGTEAGKSTAGTNSVPRPTSSGGGGVERLGAKLEEETEVDILLARKRREANDRYFQRVNQGVIDVVSKLEDVAVAMRAVEQESKDVWSESEGIPGVKI